MINTFKRMSSEKGFTAYSWGLGALEGGPVAPERHGSAPKCTPDRAAAVRGCA